jgi:hypothetical protein
MPEEKMMRRTRKDKPQGITRQSGREERQPIREGMRGAEEAIASGISRVRRAIAGEEHGKPMEAGEESLAEGRQRETTGRRPSTARRGVQRRGKAGARGAASRPTARRGTSKQARKGASARKRTGRVGRGAKKTTGRKRASARGRRRASRR